MAAIAVLLLAVSAGVVWWRRLAPPVAPANAMHFLIPPPENTSFYVEGPPVISADRRRLAFTTIDAAGLTRIWVRALDSLYSRPLAGTENALEPFWSPDGKWIGFYADRKLKRVSTDGGAVQTIANVPAAFGASWNRDDQILFGTSFRIGPLMSVPAGGGEPKVVTGPSPKRLEIGSHWPAFLPDGREFLYYNVTTDRQKRGIVLASADRPDDRTPLLQSETNAVFVPDGNAGSGHILFQRDGNLMARQFDQRQRKFGGEAALAAEQVLFNPFLRRGMFSASENNILVFRSGMMTSSYQLTWYDREGREVGQLTTPPSSRLQRVAHNGSRVTVQATDERTGGFDIWVIDTARGVPTRLTFEARDAVFPVFSPDGSRVLFCSTGNGPLDLYTVSTSGGGNETLVLKDDNLKFPLDWTRDGKFILYLSTGETREGSIWALPVSGGKQPIRVVASGKFGVGGGRVSPDGRYLSYTSAESGRPEVYVREFKPDDPESARRWQVSADGGVEATWDPAGKELYYINAAGMLMAVDTAGFVSTEKLRPRALFRLPVRAGPEMSETNTAVTRYDVGSSQRFLILKSSSIEDKSPIHVLVNWTSALRK